jgi:hypothetical protein
VPIGCGHRQGLTGKIAAPEDSMALGGMAGQLRKGEFGQICSIFFRFEGRNVAPSYWDVSASRRN